MYSKLSLKYLLLSLINICIIDEVKDCFSKFGDSILGKF